MIRGTTPTFSITIRDPGGLDLTRAANVYVTIEQGRVQITKTGEDLEVSPASVQCRLTQEEALSFAEGKADIQLNWTAANLLDGSLRRCATKVARVMVDKQLLDEVVG